MPDIDLPLWLDLLLIAGVVAGAITAIAKAWTDVIVPYMVQPVAVAVDRALERLVEEHLVPIRAELHTNGGSSLKDAVLRIERRQEGFEAYTHSNFHSIINHLTVLNQADPALRELRERLASASDTAELKEVAADASDVG